MEAMVVFWLIVLGVMIVAELATMGLATIWFAGGALVACIAAIAGGKLPIQVILFFVVSFVLLFFTRPLAKKSFNTKREKTNAETLIGEIAVVTEAIDNIAASGAVQIRGLEWMARTRENQVRIPKEAIVRVLAIEGAKLIVEDTSDREAETMFEE